MSRRAAIHLLKALASATPTPRHILICAIMLIGIGSLIRADSAAAGCEDYRNYLHATTRIDSGGSILSIAFDGSYLYLADQFHGLLIHDLDSPTPGDTIATVPTTDIAEAVVYQFPYVYLACRQAGLIVVDVSDPYHPQWVGQHAPVESAVALSIRGNRVFMADSDYGLLILDISNPTAPAPVGELAISGGLDDLVLVDSYVYAVNEDGLVIVDVLNPVSPSLVANLPLSERSFSIDAGGSLIFVGTRNLEIISASNPTSPSRVASFPLGSTVTDVKAEGTLVYVCDFEQGLSILDVQTPNSPILVANQGTLHNARSLAVDETRVFAGDTSGLSIFDATNPATLEHAGQFQLEGPLGDIALNDNAVFIADQSRGLVALRLDPVAGPMEIAHLDVPGGLNGIALDGRFLYTTGDDRSLRVLDVGNPASVSQAALIGLDGEGQGVAVIGNQACVITRLGLAFGQLDVVDIETPSNPEVVGTLVMQMTSSTAIATDGVYAYLSNWETGLVIVDISDPSVPQIVATVSAPGHARDVIVHGSHAYLASGKAFYAIDVSDPTHPFPLASTLLPAEVTRLAAEGDHLYVGTAGSGVTVFAIADASEISSVGGVAAGQSTSALALCHEQLLVGSNEAGLLLYPAQCSTDSPPPPNPEGRRVLLSPTPNPSRQGTVLRFNLPRSGDVKLEIYDIMGRRVIPLVDGPRGGGSGEYPWDGRDAAGRTVPAGFYLVRLNWNDHVETRRLIRLR